MNLWITVIIIIIVLCLISVIYQKVMEPMSVYTFVHKGINDVYLRLMNSNDSNVLFFSWDYTFRDPTARTWTYTLSTKKDYLSCFMLNRDPSGRLFITNVFNPNINLELVPNGNYFMIGGADDCGKFLLMNITQGNDIGFSLAGDRAMFKLEDNNGKNIDFMHISDRFGMAPNFPTK